MKLFKIMDTAFSNFDNTVRTYLQKTFSDLGLHYTHNQIFGVIFDGIKGIMQNVMFYIEDAFSEQNIFTATRKKSIYSLAKISGYEPFYGSAATGTILCSTIVNNGLPSNASKLYIYNETQIRNKITNTIYSIVLPTNYYIIDVNKPLITHEFKIVQGVYKTATYVANGVALETINITGVSSYDKNYITITINGEVWTSVGNLYEMTENSHNYIITAGYDNTMNLTFGNGMHGKILDKGQSIVIRYLNHIGTRGNINTYDNYSFEFIGLGQDSKGNGVNINNFLNIKMNKLISGGNDADTIDVVKQMIGYNSRSSVLASEDNFKLFLKRFSFIGQSSIWCEENTSCVIITALTNYYSINQTIENYFDSEPKNFFLSDNQKTLIKETLNNSNKGFAGISLKFQDPIIRRFAMICYVKANTVYNQDIIRDNIKDIVAKYFIKLDSNTTFIPKSNLITEIINNDNNIESIDFQFISELAQETFAKGYYYKYNLEYTKTGYNYVKQKVFYEPNTNPGLDDYGNISLDTKLEIPMLRGGFDYYPNMDSGDKSQSIKIDAIQIFFI